MTNLDVSADSSSQPLAPEVPLAAKLQEEEEEVPETSPERSGPPSETSSQDWDRLTDPGSQSITL